MPASDLYIGLMSGTSLDGIDCALVDFSGPQPRLLASSLTPFEPALKAELIKLQQASENEIHHAALAANALAQAYAKAIGKMLDTVHIDRRAVRAVGMHGQTIRHRPDIGYTTQIGNAALLAELCDIDVVADFRSRDVAAGGQGAPLVPAFHHGAFGGSVHRVIANIGGIANLTDLKPGALVRGWDTGPGNVLMDGWIARHRQVDYDADGAWAATGTVIPELLDALLQEPFFAQHPPKSTGRDLFHLRWLDAQLAALSLQAIHHTADIQATLLELSARSIADSLRQEAATCQEVYVCGGGARNGQLMARLRALLAPRWVSSTESLGMHPDWVEAIAFAWLARQCVNQQYGNLPAVTGAGGARILGAIYQA